MRSVRLVMTWLLVLVGSVAAQKAPDVNRILADIQKFSEPFGTKITIENGVGVIKVPRDATVPVGGNLRSTFGPVAPRGRGPGG